MLQAPASVKRGDVCVVRMLPLRPLILESFADNPPLGRICWYFERKVAQIHAMSCCHKFTRCLVVRLDSGCVVAVGVVKTVGHLKGDLPPPPKVAAARAAKAAAASKAGANA